MEVDGAEVPSGGPRGAPSSSRSEGKSASFFLSKADECFSSFPPNFQLAVKFLEKGLSLHPNDVEILQRLAGEYAEAGKIEEAKEMLQKAIELEPSSGPLKFLQLAQLVDGSSCLPLYERGIALLESSLLSVVASGSKDRKENINKKKKKEGGISRGFSKENSSNPEAAGIRMRLVGAYCAVAELFMTDLCDEDDAERNAEKAIKRALEIQPDNPEALLCDAQLKKVRDDSEGAVASARRLFSLITEIQERLRAASFLTAEAKLEDDDADWESEEEGTSLETRVNACRLFIDVGMAQEAIEVLKSCLEEDDEDPQAWFVLCCALFKSNELEDALHCLQELRDRLQRCGLPGDHPMFQHEKQLRELVEKGLTEKKQSQQKQQQEQDDGEASDSELTSSEDEGMDVA